MATTVATKRTVIEEGTIYYRTKLMDARQAFSFARCIRGNKQFKDVQIVESKRSKEEKYYIEFRPVNEERILDMHQGEVKKREIRAKENIRNFLFWNDEDNTMKYWCYSIVSGETYEVFPGSCSCRDWEVRCRQLAIQCKHQIALRLQQESGMIE